MIKLTCICFLLIVSVTWAKDGPLVKISDGLIRGTYRTSTNGRTFAAFEGIPFAKPPILKLRFKEPQPVEPWSGVLLTNTEYACIQYTSFIKVGVAGQEDCLYLNVYIPREKINPEERLDVIVHIHGGAFMMGSSTSFSGPNHLMDRDVVFVSMNYRLGPFGFLSSETSDITGNFGLKDQSFALQWIKDNIATFGGNPDSVTITGLSAGGASVHLHYFSPMSKGLFHRGFAQSGTALLPWSLQKHPYENLKKLSTALGCFHEKVPIILECLRQRPALQIAEAIKLFHSTSLLPLTPFAPVAEFISHSSFMTIPPFHQLGTNITSDLPLIISMTTEEGILPSGFFYNQLDTLNRDWENLFPLMLEYYHLSDEEKARINRVLKKNYFKDEPITVDNFKSFIKLCNHRLFLVGSVKAAKMQSKVATSPVYYFMMGYGGDTSLSKIYTGADIDLGVPHGGDAIFYFNSPRSPRELTKNETEMKDKLLDMLVNFAKTGNGAFEGVKWKPVTDSESLDYVLVKGPHDIATKSSKKIAPISFWTSLGLKEDENIYTFTEAYVQMEN